MTGVKKTGVTPGDLHDMTKRHILNAGGSYVEDGFVITGGDPIKPEYELRIPY